MFLLDCQSVEDRKMTKTMPDPPPRKLPVITPQDIVVAVMGITGAGKSTFIDFFSDESAGIGHGLESCTAKVEVFPSTLPDGTKLFLVDTPGFDDTHRSDTDILGEVANWLNDSFQNKIKLTGIIYLHRISDVRVGHAAMKNLRMFKALCGEDGLASVVLATTHWARVTPDEGAGRETQLIENPKMWKKMVEHGSEVWRHDRDRKSALEIVQYLIKLRRPVNLKIQEEMGRGATLDETAAGQEVHIELEKQKREYEKKLVEMRREMEEAIAKKDFERQEELENFKAQMEMRQERMLAEERKLRADAEMLRLQKEDEARQERAEMLEKLRQTELAVEREKMRLERERIDSKHALNLQALEMKLKIAEAERDRVKAELEQEPSGCIMM